MNNYNTYAALGFEADRRGSPDPSIPRRTCPVSRGLDDRLVCLDDVVGLLDDAKGVPEPRISWLRPLRAQSSLTSWPKIHDVENCSNLCRIAPGSRYSRSLSWSGSRWC